MVIDFSDRLRELRLEKGYSQATLSQKITNLGQPLSEAALAKDVQFQICRWQHTWQIILEFQ